ncbi:MAG: hypothetical protein IIY14_04455 [Bacteroidales bacterium]|jgi:hypothetical protein|nr:hypothetical protein [Bacteroidales bacterium]MBO7256014.1 hypothetical protein [Bacteroidales bacterium]MBO7284341.1 hypothetical protein [Bacteroidales bacterium]MBO7322109.1 hypothetical protein [Bacteroidales bacterium]MBQ1280359.1 hypothetical protein [Bacteroidales bacterium]
MKKIFALVLGAVLAVVMVSSCSKLIGGEASFEESFLYGKWQSGTLFYKYASDYTGRTWDTSDDVTEEEGTRFTWQLVNAELTHIYVTELSADGTKASVPKVYTVTTLTANTLVYEDDYGVTYTFSKVN